MASRILVLGAAGFIGRRLIEVLQSTDWAVPVAAVRHSRAAFPPSVELTVLDATDRARLQESMTGIAGVVNCVAGNAKTILDGASALASAQAQFAEPPRVVHLSSLAAYGSAQGSVNESAPLRGDLNEYSSAKALAERAFDGCPSVMILRPGIVYGARSPWWSDRIARLLVARRLGDLGTRGEGICNLLYIDDVVQAIVRALQVPQGHPWVFNLGLNSAPTWNEYFRRYALALGVAPLKRISLLQLALESRIIAPVLKVAEVLAGSQGNSLPPPIRPWLLKQCRHAIRMEVERAESVLSMRWTPLDEGLQHTAKWFRDGGRT